MDTTKRFVVLSILAGIIDTVIPGIFGVIVFFLCKKIFSGSDALSTSLFMFAGTTVFYRMNFVPIEVMLKQRKLKLLWALSVTPVIFVIGFFYGICSIIVVPIAYFLSAAFMNYECFVILYKRNKAIFD